MLVKEIICEKNLLLRCSLQYCLSCVPSVLKHKDHCEDINSSTLWWCCSCFCKAFVDCCDGSRQTSKLPDCFYLCSKTRQILSSEKLIIISQALCISYCRSDTIFWLLIFTGLTGFRSLRSGWPGSGPPWQKNREPNLAGLAQSIISSFCRSKGPVYCGPSRHVLLIF